VQKRLGLLNEIGLRRQLAIQLRLRPCHHRGFIRLGERLVTEVVADLFLVPILSGLTNRRQHEQHRIYLELLRQVVSGLQRYFVVGRPESAGGAQRTQLDGKA
jgi:hypothetical protein